LSGQVDFSSSSTIDLPNQRSPLETLKNLMDEQRKDAEFAAKEAQKLRSPKKRKRKKKTNENHRKPNIIKVTFNIRFFTLVLHFFKLKDTNFL